MPPARRLYLLCGPSLAGKSTVTRALAADLGVAVVSADAINAARGFPFGLEGMPESAWAEILGSQIKELADHMKRGVSVAVDDTACYRWLRDRFREEAAAGGYDCRIVYVPSSREEILARHQRLSKTKERPVLSHERLIDHLDRFEPPEEDEPHVTIRSAEDLRDFLDRERSALSGA
ncbi:MAG TPA: ATP-binding protein [Thermoanaerobaculia bacterium]|nr:ATP-binding protein [Thermoanaerobaculia bacterium]